ncbi:hypothetical protein GCM10011613_33180 [Cellvibrio zantedeschiae]|uniref:TonB C-terminal domain-containing protein n=1 Tax=Cellvibrio zantedeschiae TaxID=1237077 RepID=A0ABQ3BDM5_9GAMM|nr:hypothetical protein GCM10011613_33180 [Cellvibrio zantedeschiae]
MLIRHIIKAKSLLVLTFLLSVTSQADDTNKSISPCTPHTKPISVGPNVNHLTDYRGEGGTVLVQLIVTSTGKVMEPAVVESTNPELNSLALKAANQFRFKPGKQPCIFKMPIKFTVN